jgi:hypothetical protein
MKKLFLKFTAVILLTTFNANAQWDITILNPFENSEPYGLCATVEQEGQGSLRISKNSNGAMQLLLYKNSRVYDQMASAIIEIVVDGGVIPYNNNSVRLTKFGSLQAYAISSDMEDKSNGFFSHDFKRASAIKIRITDSRGTSYFTFNITGSEDAYKEISSQKSEKGTIVTEDMYDGLK